jgi:hypothetical protein
MSAPVHHLVDHVFICTAPRGPAAELLRQAGLTEGTPNRYPGQGTACRRFFFSNAMLELLWLEDAEEARSEQTRAMKLWERLAAGKTASPFGIILRPAPGSEPASPWRSWNYPASNARAGAGNCRGHRIGRADVVLHEEWSSPGRQPTVAGLDLEKAGVAYSEKGISVDSRLRTNVKHIYAAGDVTGGYQFTHFAGWQAFQATRNALLPGSSSGLTDLVPWVTFTDPEVAHVGLTEEQATSKFGESVSVYRWEMARTDRAVCEDDRDGFIKLITEKDGRLLGATVVDARAGETITEFIVAMKNGLKVSDLAGAIHAYPTYSTPVQQLAAEMATEHTLAGASGKIIRGISKIIR